VVGVVSSTDLIAAQAETRSAAERDVLLEQTPVQDIMTPRPLVIESTAEVHEAARHMLYTEVRRLFVEDDGEVTLVPWVARTTPERQTRVLPNGVRGHGGMVKEGVTCRR
jgi:CBS domain-containing protein